MKKYEYYVYFTVVSKTGRKHCSTFFETYKRINTKEGFENFQNFQREDLNISKDESLFIVYKEELKG